VAVRSPDLRRTAVRAVVRAREARWSRLARSIERAASARDADELADLLLRSGREVAAAAGRLHGSRPRRPLPRIAVLDRAQFTDDARRLAGQLGEARVLLLRREALKSIGLITLPAGIGDLDYRTAIEREPVALRRHRQLLSAVWKALDPDGRIRLVVTANTSYWAEVEFGAALEELGVAFVALHKENLKSPGHVERWAPVYRETRAPFHGRAALVQNAAEADLQVRAGVAPAERIDVVGMARLDTFHAHRIETAGDRVDGDVLFAGFLPGLNLPTPVDAPGREPTLGLPLPDLDQRPEHLVEACFALNRVAADVARRFPDRRVVIKTKGRAQDRRWAPLILAHAAGEAGIPGNLDLVHGGDAIAMTKHASVVVGLNSTMLLEALAAGRPAVVLELGEMSGPARPFLIDLDGAAIVVRDEVSAATTIGRLVEDPPAVPLELDQRTRELLERWTANASGDATERTLERLREYLQEGPRAGR
jgi:hypothetical protein